MDREKKGCEDEDKSHGEEAEDGEEENNKEKEGKGEGGLNDQDVPKLEDNNRP